MCSTTVSGTLYLALAATLARRSYRDGWGDEAVGDCTRLSRRGADVTDSRTTKLASTLKPEADFQKAKVQV